MSTSESRGEDDCSTPPLEKEKEREDLVAKYKRLLAMARSSLEAKQATLLEKDTQIRKLRALLEEETAKSRQPSFAPDEDGEDRPRSVLRRVDVDGIIHVLIEYTGNVKDTWFQFRSEGELNEWIQAVPGAPLKIPPKCLTVEESENIEVESKKKVDRIVEEFRRYKVRNEIFKKQKDSDQKHQSPAFPTSIEQAMDNGALGYYSAAYRSSDDASINGNESKRIRESNKWKLAYESVVKENEQLKQRGGEALLAAQWRERYEICMIEKEELSEKIKLLTNFDSNSGTGSRNGEEAQSSEPAKSFRQLYMDLKEEYKEFRTRVLELEKERERKRKLRRSGGSDSKDRQFKGELSSRRNGNKMNLDMPTGSTSKLEYIKNLVLQYLSCKDPVVRNHMEDALIQMFRFNDDEKNAIEERKKVEESYEDALLSSITSFVSSAFGSDS